MQLTMKIGATREEVERACADIRSYGFKVHENKGAERVILGVVGSVDVDKASLIDHFSTLPGVESVRLISDPFKLASRQYHPANLTIKLDGIVIGGRQIIIIAGPCSVESEEQMFEVASAVKEAGAHALRGGAFKPRTSPHSFQGLGEEGLKILAKARDHTGLPVVTEVMSIGQIALISGYADFIQVGARNMSNFELLKELGRNGRPVLLKRGPGAKIDDYILAAEYLISEGNKDIILCERGVIGFDDKYTRNIPDISAIPILKKKTYFPVIFDPSHATGDRSLIIPMSLAAIAAGADGLIVEVHPNPAQAKSDAKQQLTPDELRELMKALRPVVWAVNRTI